MTDITKGEAEEAERLLDRSLLITAGYYGYDADDLRGPDRHADIVRARQVGMYLARTLTAFSLPEIGRCFGNRHHTTVLHAIRKIENISSLNRKLREEIYRLKILIRGRK